MRNEFVLFLSLALLVAESNPLTASPAREPNLTKSPPHAKSAVVSTVALGDLIPLSAPSRRSPREFVPDLPSVRADKDGLVRYDGDTAPRLLRDAAGGSGGERSYVPVLFSLLVPGTGEIYMGYYKRGIALVAAEVVAWTGYGIYHNKGLDSREAYERFADEHWSYDKWIFDHRAVRDLAPEERTFENLYEIGETTWDEWPGFHSWYSKEEEKQNYYENIGKYDWFISGWEDWQWDDVQNPDNPPRDTPLRDEYRAMRKKSNDELDKAHNFIYLSLAARVFSLVETVLLVRKDDGGERQEEAKKFTIGARATGLYSGKVELNYRW
ncbi:MAG: hypothetical protein P8181_00440 [bacterium]